MDCWPRYLARHCLERRIRSSVRQLQRPTPLSLRLTRPVTAIVSTMHGMHHMEKASILAQNRQHLLIDIPSLRSLPKMHSIPIVSLYRDNIQPNYISAIVMVKWPYSSKSHKMAVILAERSLRLRRANGQVKVRFTGADALTLAMADITIGDEMRLRLEGAVVKSRSDAEQLRGGTTFELCYTEAVAVQVLRDGVEVFNLNTNVDTGVVLDSQRLSLHTSAIRKMMGCQ